MERNLARFVNLVYIDTINVTLMFNRDILRIINVYVIIISFQTFGIENVSIVGKINIHGYIIYL